MARFHAVSLRLQTRGVLGHSGTQLVVAGAGWNSVLCSKAQTCFLARLQTLASTPLEVLAENVILSEAKNLRSKPGAMPEANRQRCFAPLNMTAPFVRG